MNCHHSEMRYLFSGELAERDIQLDVLEPPTWKIPPQHSTGVEEEKVNFYSWSLEDVFNPWHPHIKTDS